MCVNVSCNHVYMCHCMCVCVEIRPVQSLGRIADGLREAGRWVFLRRGRLTGVMVGVCSAAGLGFACLLGLRFPLLANQILCRVGRIRHMHGTWASK